MYNLCYGMKTINLTQLPGGNLSHPNQAIDMAGSDVGIDFWYAQGRWKCMAGPWGNGTYFFCPVDENGKTTQVHCADGKDRIVTLALTHSEQKYVKSIVGKIYENGTPMYEEGVKGWATGNHIHAEVAEGIKTTKYKGSDGTWRMNGELKILQVMYVNKSFSKVSSYSLGKDKLQYCESENYSTSIKTGWRKESGYWYYYKNNTRVKGWQKLPWSKGENWFYFDSEGKMLTGWQKLKWSKGTDWFYFDNNGCMLTGNQTVPCYFNASGALERK